MKREKAPDDLGRQTDNPDLLVITGSRLYGSYRTDDTGNIVSDTDLRGFVVPSWQYQLRLLQPKREWDIMEYDGDHVIYSLRWFLSTLVGCNPQLVECLFAPETHIIKVSDRGREVLANRDAFVCKRFYRRIVGFGNSEWRKARGVKDIMPKRTPQEGEVVEMIRNVFGPHWGDPETTKDNMDQILEVLFSGHERIQVSSVDGITLKRRDEFEKFGYCVSSACHSLRLMQQCAELLRTGSMTFPRPNADVLRAIKQGKVAFADVERMYEAAKTDCDEAYASSTLREEPDIERIQSLYLRLATSVSSWG
jgi:hypothetical protein